MLHAQPVLPDTSARAIGMAKLKYTRVLTHQHLKVVQRNAQKEILAVLLLQHQEPVAQTLTLQEETTLATLLQPGSSFLQLGTEVT